MALGDSITDGSVTTIDANRRWPDLLSTVFPGYYSPQKEALRQGVNHWIRSSGEFLRVRWGTTPGRPRLPG